MRSFNRSVDRAVGIQFPRPWVGLKADGPNQRHRRYLEAGGTTRSRGRSCRGQPRRGRRGRASHRRRLRACPGAARGPHLVQARGVLRGVGPGVLRRQLRRLGRPARSDRTARLPEVAWRRLPLAAAVLRLPVARRRLRHPRLLQGAAGVRHGRRLRRAARRRAPARHPGHHRPGHEPHLRIARVVPGVAPRPRRALRRLLRLERHQREVHATPGSSSSTPRSRTGPSTRCAGSSTGTGSSRTSPT